jgi:hypothetical protein
VVTTVESIHRPIQYPRIWREKRILWVSMAKRCTGAAESAGSLAASLLRFAPILILLLVAHLFKENPI